ncbi:helix-turn-helix domain-containing protein [uncultured Lactococcus sp.]|uniref:helix-turn-helix domain-containing protein n=1 Tax=uncultured Lactococcus sp. TaxID=167973 RepID=UPI0027DE9F46|nr:helix-turn-helix domain-containing protein [uncultured Lactococcus sp.]
MLKYLDEDDFKKLQILYYLENHHLFTVLFDDLIEELHLNNYQVKKLLSEIQAEIKSWKLENYYLIDLQTQKSFVRYERRTQGNIMLLLNHYVKRSQMQALIRAIFTEEVNKIAELEDIVFLSKSATYKLVKKFTDLTKEYDVTIDKNMRFAGDEWKIREFLYNFYHTLYGDLYKSFSEDVATDLEQMIKALEEIEGLFIQGLSLTDRTKLLYRLFVIYTRNYLGNKASAQDFMKIDSRFIEPIAQILRHYLDGSNEEVLEETYELLYFLSSESITAHCDFQIPTNVRELTLAFTESFNAKFKEHQNELNQAEVQVELNNIHLRLLVSLRANFDVSSLNDFNFMGENYEDIELFCNNFADKMLLDTRYAALFQEKHQALVREYMFLILCHTTAYRTRRPVKICVDFSYGISYNRYILENIKSLGFLNIEASEGKNKENIDIYLSNLPSREVEAEQIIWASPPTSYDWEFFGNTVVKVKKDNFNA